MFDHLTVWKQMAMSPNSSLEETEKPKTSNATTAPPPQEKGEKKKKESPPVDRLQSYLKF